jgi:hypothetical protein
VLDIETQSRLVVHVEGDAGPYLLVPVDQLADVRGVLERNRIAHSLASDAIRLDGKLAVAIIDFGRRAEAGAIQAALDAA